MNRAKVVAAIACLSAVSFIGAASPPPPVVDKASAAIWEAEIHGKKTPCILDNWELVEGLPLCKEVGQISNRLAAFATVAFFGEPRVGIKEFELTEKKFIVLAQDIKGTSLTEDEKKKTTELFEKARSDYGDRKDMALYGTFMMGDALLLNETIKDCKTVKEAVERIGKVHGWVATLEEGADLPFEKYKEAIDKRIPILLERDNRYVVGVGYVRTGGKDFLVIADLSETPLEQIGMSFMPSEREIFESLPPDHPERKMYEYDKKNKRFTVDFTISSAKPLVVGITIEPFELSKYKAYFIYNWRVSAEAWRDEIAKIVGPKTDEKPADQKAKSN